MRHTPGKRTPAARQSGHKITRARAAAAWAVALARGDVMQANRFAQMLDRREHGHPPNQRQKRKARRARHAAGDRRAFS